MNEKKERNQELKGGVRKNFGKVKMQNVSILFAKVFGGTWNWGNRRFPRFRKGQYEIVEIVIIFSIGIIVLGGLVLLFTQMSARITEPIQGQQLNMVGNVLLARIFDLAKLNQSGAEFRVSVPETASNSPYSIIGTGNQLSITTRENSINKTTPVAVSGTALSAQKNLLLRLSVIQGRPQVDISGFTVY